MLVSLFLERGHNSQSLLSLGWAMWLNLPSGLLAEIMYNTSKQRG